MVTTILLIALGIVILSSILTLIPDYKYYNKTYKELPNLIFKEASCSRYNYVASKDHKVIWFANEDSFKLTNIHYIHNSFYTYLNPYSLYWLIKYKKWFKQNCNHLKK